MPILFPFVGREAESRWLQEHIHRLSDGQGGLILVGGEAGVGKTRLVSSALATVDTDITQVTSRCPGLEEASPFGPWREALLCLQRTGHWDTDTLPAPFGRAPASAAPYELSLALVRWLQEAGRKVIFTIEDLQWSDAASLQLLVHLSGRLEGTPLLIICIYRSEEVHMSPTLRRVLPEMIRTGSTRMILNDLHLSEVESLVRFAMPATTDVSRVARDIYHLTAGLPLFVTELLEWMHQRGTLSLHALPATETVQAVIHAKLSRLAPEHLNVLETAALMGELFSYRPLTEILDESEDTITAALETAIQRGVIFAVTQESNRFQFRHALVREVLANRIVGFRRSRLHQRIGQVLERTVPDEVDTIAFHYSQAGDARAIPFLIAAGDRALQVGALRDAELRYREASRKVPQDDHQLADILLKLGLASRWHQDDEAIHCWNRALDIAIDTGDRPLEAWLRHLLLELAFNQGDMTRLNEIKQLSALQEQLLDDPRYQQIERQLYKGVCGYPRIQIIHCDYLYNLGKLEEAEALVESLRTRARGENMHLLQMQTMIAAYTGRLQITAELTRQMSQMAYAQKNYWRASLLYVSSLYHRFLYQADCPGEIDGMVEELLRLELEIADKGSHGYLPAGYSGSGFYQYLRGDWKGAYHHLVEYVTHESKPLPLITWFAAVMLVETRAVTHLPSVLAKLAPFHPSDPPTASVLLLTWGHAVRAQAHLAQGEPDLAKAWLDAADSHPLGRASKSHRPFIDLTWAEYYRQTGNMEAALDACRRALEWAESVPIQWFIIKAKRMLGELLAVTGAVEDAVGLIQSGRDLARQCRIPYEAALCELSAGRILANFLLADPVQDKASGANTEQAIQFLQSARDEFAKLGAPQFQEADVLLASLREFRPIANRENTKRGEAGSNVGIDVTFNLGHVLTRREMEVALLVADGLTDRQVAAHLYVSVKTVDHHLRSIFRKLDINNRSSLAALVARSRS